MQKKIYIIFLLFVLFLICLSSTEISNHKMVEGSRGLYYTHGSETVTIILYSVGFVLLILKFILELGDMENRRYSIKKI